MYIKFTAKQHSTDVGEQIDGSHRTSMYCMWHGALVSMGALMHLSQQLQIWQDRNEMLLMTLLVLPGILLATLKKGKHWQNKTSNKRAD